MEKRFQLFTTLVAKCSRAIKKIKSVEMVEYDLKSPHVSCLYYLYSSSEPLTAKELCDVCDEDKAEISRSLKYLEQEGFITCNSKCKKRYKSPLELTLKGEKVALHITEKINKIVETASKGLLEENRKIFYESLILISNNLENIIEGYGE